MTPERHLTDLKAGDRKIVIRALHVEVLTHSAHICVAEVGLVKPFCEVRQTSIREDKEVDLV
jgi:hypothetical protein